MAVITKKMYTDKIAPVLKDKLGKKNINQVPVIEKVTINVGLGKGLKDARYLETVEATLTGISGQKPIKTLSRKSIASFKIRAGMPVGMIVTIRGARMWHFLNKLVNVAFARVRDFRGISHSAVDAKGNFSYGFPEQVAFPEVSPEDSEIIHGLQVNITTSAKTHEEGMELFRSLGFPFKEK